MDDRYAELRALKQEIFAGLHCALAGIVVSYDGETRTAVIRPAVKSRSGRELPLLRDVPVYMPISFEVSESDPCLVVFADCDTDRFLTSGEIAAPASARMHSLSDGFAFVGFGEPAPSPGGDSLGFYIDEDGYICQETEGDEA